LPQLPGMPGRNRTYKLPQIKEPVSHKAAGRSAGSLVLVLIVEEYFLREQLLNVFYQPQSFYVR
jgi:hypothetical protein